jgi:hypothetical protein
MSSGMKTWRVFPTPAGKPQLLIYGNTEDVCCAACQRWLFSWATAPDRSRWGRGLVRMGCGFECALVVCPSCLEHPPEPTSALSQALTLLHDECGGEVVWGLGRLG